MARAVDRAITLTPILVDIVTTLSLVLSVFIARPVSAAEINNRSIEISNGFSQAQNVTYNVSLDIAAQDPLGSIAIQYCSNSPLIGDICDPPPGFDTSNTAMSVQSGVTGFAVSSTSTANELILTRPPASAAAASSNYVITGVKNPDNPGPLYARILTYATSDASGPETDSGGIALEINDSAINISTEVPPYLIFCIGGSIANFDCSTATDSFADLGTLSPLITSAAQNQMLVATNAANGYSMWAAGTTMTSGNNVINPLTSPSTANKGASQFGMNLRANQTPSVGQDPQGAGTATATSNFNQANKFFFHSGDVIASNPVSDNYRKFTASYIVDIPDNQPGGVYSTTLTYVCLANF